MKRGRSRSLTHTLIAGAIAGLAGAWAMSKFAQLATILGNRGNRRQRSLPYSQQEWDASIRIAQIVGSGILRHRLRRQQEQAGAVLVHYAVGAATGAVYAMLTQRSSQIRKYAGAVFGAGEWLLANELLMPLAGIGRELSEYSIATQATALGEHIVYAVTTDTFLRAEYKVGWAVKKS